MPLHVKLRGSYDLGERVSLVELRRLLDFFDQSSGHRFAGLVVLRVVRKHGRIRRPILVELRRELHEVASHRGAGQRGVLRVGEHAMQGMTEFVKHRGHVAEVQQRGLAGRGLRKVGHVEHHGQRAQ